MEELTRTTTLLLSNLHDPSNGAAWEELCARCVPIIRAYALKRGLQVADCEDVAQETLADFAVAYRAGQYDRAQGRLRQWLSGFARRRVAKFLTKRARREEIVALPDHSGVMNDAVGGENIDALWEEEWERHLVHLCKEQVRREFDEKQYRAFDLYALRGRPAADVATELGMTANAVYIAKTRILTRLRELQEDLAQVW